MKKFISLLIIILLASLQSFASNTVTNVTVTITGAKTVSTAVDYTIKASTPFSGNGSVNITNTDNAVVIFANIKPTVVLSTWLGYIKINGAAAVNGTNCQVKQYGKYGHGTIIMPYASDFAPLTCYTGQNYSGTSCNAYTTGSDGGYMKTLSADNLNNQIRSFKLKRGYMVTFAVGTGGWGYSRCFVADDADLEFPVLPACMDAKISSYRLFQWRDFGKAGLASDISASDNGTLNSSWCYEFNVGSEVNEDCEIVTHRVQKWWPGIADCGKVETPIMKTDNEPANSSDDQPATVDEVLGYWESAMRTGKRLCSPSDYDGDNTWLPEFFEKIDARGWRCDIYDIHCYWPLSSFSNLQTCYNNFKRPIMISELMWGASWNSNGIFNSSTNTQADMLTNGKTIVDELNSWDYIESYAWWNSESTTASKVIENGTLTSFGEYYSNMATGLGYNKTYDVVPNAVYSTPGNLAGVFSSGTTLCTLNWTDRNGDMIDSMVVERSVPGNYTFVRDATIKLQEYTGGSINYSYAEKLDKEGEYRYRIAIYPAGETTPLYSDIITVQAGKAVGYVDVTDDYIKNWGFDTAKDYSMGNVSRGTYNSVSGWTLYNGSEWGASACFPIGSSKTLNSGAIPAKDLNGDIKGGVLAFSSGWSSECRYTQDVTLPAGDYKLTYCVYNSTNNTSFTNLTGVTIDTTNHYGTLTSIPGEQWRSETIDFSLAEEATVTFSVGYQGSNSTTTSNALLRYDYIKLEKARTDGTDCTSTYVTNPGFDVTGDYQKVNLSTGESNHKSVTGWTTTGSSTWGCSACFEVGSSNTCNTATPPSSGTGGTLGISEGWGGAGVYTQDVTLPAGTYSMKYAIYNGKVAGTFTNLTGVVIGENTYYGKLTSVEAGEWATDIVMFNLTEETAVTLSVGAQFASASSSSNPILFFDYVSLTRLNDEYVAPEKEEEELTPGDDVTDHFDTEGFSAAKYTGSTDGITGCEVFNWGASLDIGSPMSQTVTLPDGYYTVEVYAMASSTSGRDNTSNVITPDGATGYVTLHANDKSLDVPAYNRTAFTTYDQYKFICVHVADGKLTVSLDMDTTGPNWLVMQIRKATYLGKVLGDTDGDGKITIADVPHLIKSLKGTTDSFDGIGDMNYDNELNVNDIKSLVNKLKE